MAEEQQRIQIPRVKLGTQGLEVRFFVLLRVVKRKVVYEVLNPLFSFLFFFYNFYFSSVFG